MAILSTPSPHPWSDGTTGIRLSPMELLEKLAALVPLPRVHLVRYGGCLAPHSHLRGAIIPTPRQQGVDKEATDTGSLCWRWARLLKRVFALDMARCPWCQEGDAADYCRHHAERGDPHDPPAPEARRGPTCHCSGTCPPRSLCVVLGLTAPRASPIPSPPDAWGGTTPQSPASPAVSPHTVRGRRGMAVRRQRLPQRASRLPCATSFALAAFLHARTRLNEASAFASVSHPRLTPQH